MRGNLPTRNPSPDDSTSSKKRSIAESSFTDTGDASTPTSEEKKLKKKIKILKITLLRNKYLNNKNNL